jgi:hypothetical protein
VVVASRKLRLRVGGVLKDVIAPPPAEFFSEAKDNSVVIVLTYGTARILLAGDTEAGEEEYMANGPYTGPLTVVRGPVYPQIGDAPCGRNLAFEPPVDGPVPGVTVGRDPLRQ